MDAPFRCTYCRNSLAPCYLEWLLRGGTGGGPIPEWTERISKWRGNMDIASLLIGAALGAFLSVIGERIYRQYMEAAPAVQVHCSCSHGIDYNEFNVVVENVGSVPIPPYVLVLYHPNNGTMRFFQATESSERLPHQRDEFSFRSPSPGDTPFQRDSFRMLRNTLTHWHGYNGAPSRPMTPEDFGEWRLRLILTHSDNFVLFEHHQAGAAIAEIVRNTIDSGTLNARGDQMMRVWGHNSWRLSARGSLRRTRRRVASIANSWNQIPQGQLGATAARWWDDLRGRVVGAVQARRTRTRSRNR
jgi:hypothetical protein